MPKAPPKPEFSTRRGNGSVALAGVDGRTLAARRFREITSRIEDDLGNDLTEAQRAIMARAATLAVWCEEAETEFANSKDFDPATYSTVANAMRRLLSDLGLKRVARDVTPSLDSYISKKGAASG